MSNGISQFKPLTRVGFVHRLDTALGKKRILKISGESDALVDYKKRFMIIFFEIFDEKIGKLQLLKS
jgi:hypothetical protein